MGFSRLKQSLQPYFQFYSNAAWLFCAQIFAKIARIIIIAVLAALPIIIVNTYCIFEQAKGSYTNETITRLVFLLITVSMLVILTPEQAMYFTIVLLFSSLRWRFTLYFGDAIQTRVLILMSLFNGRKFHEY